MKLDYVKIKIQSCGPFQSLKVFFPLHTWGPYSEAILGQPTVRFIRPQKPKCSLALELYLGPEKREPTESQAFLCVLRKLSFWWFISWSLDNFLRLERVLPYQKRGRGSRREKKEVLTPNFYGIEKKGWIKKVCKRNFFSCQGKTQKNWNTFFSGKIHHFRI